MSLPVTRIGSLTVTRLVVGGNPISGFSHGGSKRDQEMLDYFTTENAKSLLRRCEAGGINTAFFRADKHVMRLIREYRNEGGKIQWVAQTAPELDPFRCIDQAKAFGANAIYIHGGQIDGSFEKGDIEGSKKQFDHARKLGLPVGVASHVPANILKIEEMGWNPDFYMICLYNIPGYRGKLSPSDDEKFVETDRAKALALFQGIEAPCFAYKILAAGRRSVRQSFEEVFRAIKPIDGVNVGMYPPDNARIVEENVALVNEFATLSKMREVAKK
jgi:hypothetical protein